MRTVEDITHVGVLPRPVVTVGTFDGVHIGHKAIIEEVTALARDLSGTSILVTFHPHPQTVVAPASAPYLLTTREEKLLLLERTELDIVLILAFTRDLSEMSARDFVREVLVDGLGLREIIVGRNHAFGRKREGGIRELEQVGQSCGFSVRAVSPVKVGGRRVSSSWIRQTIQRGDVSKASALLGRPYSFRGEVIAGTGRGRTLRFPTANIRGIASRKLYPPDGVYAIWARLRDRRHGGIMNIGHRPTFQHAGRTIEVHLFDFDENLYGREVEVEVVERIRDERQFNTEEELVAQIEKDRAKSLEILPGSLTLTEVS